MGSAKHPFCSRASTPRPAPGEVHLWRWDLDRAVPDLDSLDATERARAARFHSPVHQHRFAVGRALLRAVLAEYLDEAPAAVRFVYGSHGRPAVPGAPFDFNLSHSENHMLLALGEAPVGVDIERRGREADLAGLARQVMTSAELVDFLASPPEAMRERFFALWTRKEAVMKALGVGFSREARSLQVGWRDPDWSEDGIHLHLTDLPLGPDLAGALATGAPVLHLRWMT